MIHLARHGILGEGAKDSKRIARTASDSSSLSASGAKYRKRKWDILHFRKVECPIVNFRTPQQNKRIAMLGGKIESLLANPPTTILDEFRRMVRPKANDLS
jgi:hypothetical protein